MELRKIVNGHEREKYIANKKMYLQYAKMRYVDIKIQSESLNIKASRNLLEQARRC